MAAFGGTGAVAQLVAHLLCKQLNYVPGELVCSFGDAHVYLNHLEQVKTQLAREPYPNLPRLVINDGVGGILNYEYNDLSIVGYTYHPAIKAPIAV